jgi:predicted nucleic acid-binding protein
MPLDPSRFHTVNVSDTCAVWNVLSSTTLYRAAVLKGCTFCFTRFVAYECLEKSRGVLRSEDAELQRRLRASIETGQFKTYHIDIEDLQDVAALQGGRRISKGELSSIVFAKRVGQAFLTDDQKARHLAEGVLDVARVQSTPQLFGWLCHEGVLTDSDKATVINEHETMRRPLAPYFEEMYLRALELKLAHPDREPA